MSANRVGEVLVRPLLALLSPTRFSEPLALADYKTNLATNEPLRGSSREQQAQALEDARKSTVRRLGKLRRQLAISFLSMGSAVVAAVVVTRLGIGIPTPATAAIIGSVFCFSWATLGRLGWGGQSWGGKTAVELLDQTIFHFLYWVGMYLAALAVL